MNYHITAKQLTKVFYTRTQDLLREASEGITDYDTLMNSLKSQDKIALNNINLTIKAGDRLGIIGPNGAGKSTLLNLLAGFAQPSAGQLVINGNITAVMSLGMVLKEHLTGRENIDLDIKIQNNLHKSVQSVTKEIIDFADLGEFIDSPVRTYSTGMKSRLAFSMLVNIKPEILIIDEALSAGDVFFSQKAAKKLKAICDSGHIVIIVSHSMQSINEMCNRCIWMENGNIIQDNSPSIVIENYLKKSYRDNDHALLKKFNRQIKSYFICNDYQVKQIAMTHQPHLTGEPFTIIAKCQLKYNKDIKLQVRVTRVDGFVVSETYFNYLELNINRSQSDYTWSLYLNALILTEGIYNIHLSILLKNTVMAANSTIAEVKMLTTVPGGRPTLIYPCSIEVTPISLEETIPCLDSTETI